MQSLYAPLFKNFRQVGAHNNSRVVCFNFLVPLIARGLSAGSSIVSSMRLIGISGFRSQALSPNTGRGRKAETPIQVIDRPRRGGRVGCMAKRISPSLGFCLRRMVAGVFPRNRRRGTNPIFGAGSCAGMFRKVQGLQENELTKRTHRTAFLNQERGIRGELEEKRTQTLCENEPGLRFKGSGAPDSAYVEMRSLLKLLFLHHDVVVSQERALRAFESRDADVVICDRLGPLRRGRSRVFAGCRVRAGRTWGRGARPPRGAAGLRGASRRTGTPPGGA